MGVTNYLLTGMILQVGLGGGFSQKYFWNFHPDPWGFMIQFDGSHIFQMGGKKTTN